MHDELRRLDDDLAAGRLDAGGYRRRRDELLAARATAPPASTPPVRDDPAEEPVAEPATELDDHELDEAERELDLAPERPEAGAVVSPAPDVTVPEPAHELDAPTGPSTPAVPAPQAATAAPETPDPAARDPFPPPFRWGDAAEPSPDATQVVRSGTAPELAAGPTQVVGRARVRAADPRTAPPGLRAPRPPAPPPPPERTQFVPGAALARAGDGRAVPARRTVPPWVSERPTSLPGDRLQGREVFTRGPGPSAATVAGTVAVVLLVVTVLVLSFVLG